MAGVLAGVLAGHGVVTVPGDVVVPLGVGSAIAVSPCSASITDGLGGL